MNGSGASDATKKRGRVVGRLSFIMGVSKIVWLSQEAPRKKGEDIISS
jgi:hypothetical protein